MLIRGSSRQRRLAAGSVGRVIRPTSVAPPGGNCSNGRNYGYAQAASAADHAIEQDSPPRELQQPLPFAGLALAIVASSLYVFPAGTPQPGDILLATTIVVTILTCDYTLPALHKLYISLGLVPHLGHSC